MTDTLQRSTTSGVPGHASIVARIHAASQSKPVARIRICSDRSVEEHELGEFPLTCYRCHVHENVEDVEDVEEDLEDYEDW